MDRDYHAPVLGGQLTRRTAERRVSPAVFGMPAWRSTVGWDYRCPRCLARLWVIEVRLLASCNRVTSVCPSKIILVRLPSGAFVREVRRERIPGWEVIARRGS